MRRRDQVEEAIAHLAGEFIAREISPRALVTVTRATMNDHYSQATIYLSVLPHAMEEEVMTFARRARSDFHSYVREHSFLHPTPRVDFELDLGEKNRQRVDELTRE